MMGFAVPKGPWTEPLN
jgi:hypothetical protein